MKKMFLALRKAGLSKPGAHAIVLTYITPAKSSISDVGFALRVLIRAGITYEGIHALFEEMANPAPKKPSKTKKPCMNARTI